MDFRDTFFAETTPLQPERIQSVRVSIASRGGFGKRQHIARDGRSSTNIGMRSYPDELVYRTQRADYRPLFYRHVSTQRRRIRQDHMIPDLAIVSDVGIRHDQG